MANKEDPRFFVYKEISARIASFDSWPNEPVQSPLRLSLAGFFYTGIGDRVKCFSCGGALQNWTIRDDPVTEHRRWFPDCDVLHGADSNPYGCDVLADAMDERSDTDLLLNLLTKQREHKRTMFNEFIHRISTLENQNFHLKCQLKTVEKLLHEQHVNGSVQKPVDSPACPHGRVQQPAYIRDRYGKLCRTGRVVCDGEEITEQAEQGDVDEID